MTLDFAVGVLICKHGGLRKCARALNVDPAYLLRLQCRYKTNPSAEMLKTLGLVKSVNYSWKKDEHG